MHINPMCCVVSAGRERRKLVQGVAGEEGEESGEEQEEENEEDEPPITGRNIEHRNNTVQAVRVVLYLALCLLTPEYGMFTSRLGRSHLRPSKTL